MKPSEPNQRKSLVDEEKLTTKEFIVMRSKFNFHLRPLQLLLLSTVLCVALSSGQLASLSSDKEPYQMQQDGAQQDKRLERALTPEEWTRKYWCDLAHPNSSLVQTNSQRQLLINTRPWPQRFWYNLIHECVRDQTTWRAQYIDELYSYYKVLVRDSSSDERLANILLTLNTHLLRDVSYFQFNSGDSKLDRENERRVAGPFVNDAQCELDLNDMTQQLDELAKHLQQVRLGSNGTNSLEERHLKMVRVLDSYGRYESGTLSGNRLLPGAYRQCTLAVIERQQHSIARGSTSKDMHMRYCWARMSLRKRINPMVKARQNQPHESGDHALPVGICLPRSCHSKNLNSEQNKRLAKRLIDSQLNFPNTIYLDQHPDLDSIYCLPDADAPSSRMPASGKLWIGLTGLWILLCCCATYFNIGDCHSFEQQQQQHNSVDGIEKVKQKGANLILSMKQQQQQQEAYNERQPPAWTNLAKCFNLRSSWKDFTSDRVQPRATAPVDLDVLNPIKVGACLFCMIAHSALMHATQTRHLLDTAAQVERDNILQAALTTSTVIDTFYVISGLLIAFIACKRLTRMAERKQIQRAHKLNYEISITGSSSNDSMASSMEEQSSCTLRGVFEFIGSWFMLSANRYLRLVPLYAFIFYFRRDVFKYLGSGPLWDYGFNRDTMTGACEQSSSLTPFNIESITEPLSKQCIATAWTLSNDILFALITPPFLLLLQKRPKLTLRFICALVVICSIYGLKVFVDQPNVERFELLEIRIHGLLMVFNGLASLYTSPIIRGASFLVGVIAGYALFKYAEQHETKRQWPSWLRGTATKLAIAYLLIHLTVSSLQMHYRHLFAPYHRLYAVYIVTLDRTAWSVANAVLFLRMTTDWRHGPFMSRFANQKWKSLARLNYPLLFVHWIIILVHVGVGTSLPSYSQWDLFGCIATIYMASLPISLIIHVVFENPIDKLIKRQIFRL